MKLDFTKKDLYSKEVKSHYELHTELEVIDDESNFKRFAIIVKKGE